MERKSIVISNDYRGRSSRVEFELPMSQWQPTIGRKCSRTEFESRRPQFVFARESHANKFLAPTCMQASLGLGVEWRQASEVFVMLGNPEFGNGRIVTLGTLFMASDAVLLQP